MLLGLTGHSILEGLIKNQIQLKDNREEIYSNIYYQNIEDMYTLKMSKEDFISDCKSKF